MDRVMRSLLAATCGILLAGCSSYQVVPTTNSVPGTRSGQVDVLYSTPPRPYISVGTVSATRYKPGWTDPSVSDALPELRAAAAKVNADAVIVRSSRSNNDRHIVVEGEAIRYTDVADQGSTSSVETAASARGFSNGRGCGDVSIVSDSNGRTVYQSKCPGGRTLIIECHVQSCDALN
ncbi:MAG: hypothetical protein ABI858_09815 [Pseudoxanthomonas sp.]